VRVKRAALIATAALLLAGCGGAKKQTLEFTVACPNGSLTMTVTVPSAHDSSTGSGTEWSISDGGQSSSHRIGNWKYEHGHVSARCAR
jgi:hypothetical protein